MENAVWDWIVPFKGRNLSGSTNQNFLCRCGNVYVMDNHRAALWCWLQELDLSQQHSLIHIDRHTDTLQSQMSEWLRPLPDWDSDIETYLDASYNIGGTRCPVIRWDNYLSIYLNEFGRSLKTLRFNTHGDGDPPRFADTLFGSIWDLPENLSYWLDEASAPWLVNIDLDYFYCDTDNGPERMISDRYIEILFSSLSDAQKRGVVKAITISLTPDSFTPGWGATEALATSALGLLGLNFELPEPKATG